MESTTDFWAAYKESGNGICEKSHCTIKGMAKRGVWAQKKQSFGIMCRQRLVKKMILSLLIFKHHWRLAMEEPEVKDHGACELNIGEEVWVKPPSVRCTSQWRRGVVTGVNSPNNVDVDGMPRHILSIF